MRYQPSPKPTDLLPEGEWECAFWDLTPSDGIDIITVDFNGKHYKYKRKK